MMMIKKIRKTDMESKRIQELLFLLWEGLATSKFWRYRSNLEMMLE